MNEMFLVGAIGFPLFFLYFLLCVWRLYNIYLVKSTTQYYKMLFHYLLPISSFFNIIYFLSLLLTSKFVILYIIYNI